MTVGYIHSIETLGTRDGPGVRFVVFLQGCPLRCKYCHNPDTWQLKDGQKITVEQLIKKIIRSRPYFERSGGGVTVSGGEPTLQFAFTLELLKKCKEENIHTVLDTSGCTDPDKFRQLIPYLDLVLLDIKELNKERHLALTGVSNDKTLEVVKIMEKEKQPYWIRHVVVPGYTDNKSNIASLGRFLKNKKHLAKVELLPYHKLGEYKWEELGLDYQLTDVAEPSTQLMQELNSILEQYNLNIA